MARLNFVNAEQSFFQPFLIWPPDDQTRTVRIDMPHGEVHKWLEPQLPQAWQGVWDALGRIARHEASRPGAQTIVSTLTYQGVYLSRIVHPLESETLSYDALGRLAKRELQQPSSRWVDQFAYDEADRLIRHELPEGGALTYTWGPGQQLRAIEMDDGRWSALLGERLAGWLGAGKYTVIEPLPDAPKPVQASASAPQNRLQQQFVAEQGYRWGNGVALHWNLNQAGQLQALSYSAPTRPTAWWQGLLPMGQAHAQVHPQDHQQTAQNTADQAPWLKWTYNYDAWGRMSTKAHTASTQAEQKTSFAYDHSGRLLVAQQGKGDDPKGADYYAYRDGQMIASRERGQSHDWRQVSIERKPSGYPTTITQGAHKRTLSYSADNRLMQVQQDGQLLARYGHNTHGQRISKQDAQGRAVTYLWSQGQLVAEANESGLKRRYVYAKGVPVAVIDHEVGAKPWLREEGAWGALKDWGQAAWLWVSQAAPQVTYLHTNEIGTPVAATNDRGQVVWQAEHSVYGAVRAVHRPGHAPQAGRNGFELNLRLPGQYFDEETGWHDNGLRTYDPQRGEYLEPDPLGPVPNWRTGRQLTQAFAYVNHNPLIYADPSGLILFAFDGTDNSVNPVAGDSISNVQKFWQAYDDSVNGPKYYITGIGTTDRNMSYEGDTKTGDGFKERVALGFEFLDKYIDLEARKKNSSSAPAANGMIDIDVVGFSRGAAEARVWVNQVVMKLKQGAYTSANGNSRCLNFRFLGLWDTVPHLGTNHGAEKNYDFSISAQVKYAVHAVAVNEHRGGLADFDGLSIFDNATVGNTATRIERGFVGAHADIGGGYGEGDLSDVALMWMINQASSQGLELDQKIVKNNGWDVVTNPLVHDPRVGNDIKELAWLDGGDRYFNYLYSKGKEQKTVTLAAGVATTATGQALTQSFTKRCGSDGSVVGLVDMQRYANWLGIAGLTYLSQPQLPANCSLQ